MKQYDGVRKVSTRQDDDYTIGCLLDYVHLKDNYKLIAVDLSKQKALDAYHGAIQQMVFQEVAGGDNNTKIRLYIILEQSKEAVNVKLSDTQLKKLKTTVKNKTGTTLRMSLKMFEGNDPPHELLLSTRQRKNLRNAFNNNLSIDLKLSKAQISKIIQSRGFLESLLSKLAGPLMKVAIPLATNVLVQLGITAATSAIDAGIQKKIYGSGTTTLIILPNEEMNGTMKIVQALEDSNILFKRVTKAIKNETKEQKGGFFSMFLGTLGASLLENMLAGKGIVRAGSGNKKGKRIVRAGYGKGWHF